MIVSFEGYTLVPNISRTPAGRFAVGVEIRRTVDGTKHFELFHAEDGIGYILELEAEAAAINLGRNLVTRNLVAF